MHAAHDDQPKPDRLFRNTEFLRLWGGQTVSSVGSGIVKLAAPLLVLALTESPTMAGLVGAAITPWLRRRVPVGWHMIAVVAVHGLALGLVTLAPNIWLMRTGLFVAGMMETMVGIIHVSYRLALIPDALQGRVNSVYRLLSFATMSIGMVIGGVLIDLYGPRFTLGVVAAWISAMAVGAAFSSIRSLRERLLVIRRRIQGQIAYPCSLSALTYSRGGPVSWSGGWSPRAAPRRRASRSRPSAERASRSSPVVSSKG